MQRSKLLVAFSAGVLIAGIQTAGEAKGRNGEIIPGKYIVSLRKGASPESVAQEHGVSCDSVFRTALSGFVFSGDTSKRDKLKKDSRIEAIEPDRIVELERVGEVNVTAGITAVTQPAQRLPTGINRADADLSITSRINGMDDRVNIDIAVIDTGIDLTHPDLNVVRAVSYIAGNTSGNDDNGHGTHVAGTIAALDNNIGVVGIAPGARLWAVKVLDASGSGSLSGIIKGVDFVTANARTIKVANMSLGMRGTSSMLNSAIQNSINAGVTYCVAAGNSRADATAYSPANHPNVICVSAVADYDGKGGGLRTGYRDADDTLADFSNYGSPVDIAAPGVSIYSAYKGGAYASMSGTSMACPHVAGAAALYVVNNPAATPAQVKQALQSKAKLQTDPMFGFKSDPDAYREPMLNVTGL